MLDIIDKLLAMEACTANDEAETLSQAADALIKAKAALSYASKRAVSQAAYPHACIEEKMLRDLIDDALASF